MNILPHKSWHVRTKKNISRVRRDEERARKEEEELQKRINLAEHESRIVQLKRKAGIQNEKSEKTSNSEKNESFDLFDDFKDKIAEDSGKQVEKKAEQEKWEVRTGIFSYLDGRYKYDNNDKTNNEWYLQSHEDRIGLSDSKSEAEDKVKIAKDKKIKSFNDPLETMKNYLNEMKKNDGDTLIQTPTTKSIKRKIPPNDLDIIKSTSKKKKKKKHKKHKRKHRKYGSSDESSDEEDESQKKRLLIEKLRAERLDREKKERERTMTLLRIPSSSMAPEDSKSGIKQKYNSQFNPHLARQNMTE